MPDTRQALSRIGRELNGMSRPEAMFTLGHALITIAIDSGLSKEATLRAIDGQWDLIAKANDIVQRPS